MKNFNSSEYNILVVDDSKSVNNIITKNFEQLGYKTFQAFDLATARQILSQTQMHYVMLDVNLPDGNGFELIQELANTPEKIFVLTSEQDQQLIEIAYQKGVIDFIVKDKNFFSKMHDLSEEIKKLEDNKEKTIVVCDDSFVIQEQLKDILQNRHYNVVTFDEPSKILECMEQTDIDLILLDLEFRNSNGIDFLQKNNKTLFEKKHIPVMIISGKTEASTVRDAYKSGAVDIIKKPYIIEELILKVDLWIDYKRKEDEISYYKSLLKNQEK